MWIGIAAVDADFVFEILSFREVAKNFLCGGLVSHRDSTHDLGYNSASVRNHDHHIIVATTCISIAVPSTHRLRSPLPRQLRIGDPEEPSEDYYIEGFVASRILRLDSGEY